jgi:hypothetical protein
MAEEARNGNNELADMFKRACALLLHTEKIRGFLAGDKMRTQVTDIVALMLECDGWNVKDLASPSDAEKHIEDSLTTFRHTAMALKQALETEELAVHVNLLKALRACLSTETRLDDLPFQSKLLHKRHLDEALKKESKEKPVRLPAFFMIPYAVL